MFNLTVCNFPIDEYPDFSKNTGAVGVENGKEGGWEKIRGDHAVKLNGRTYHFLAKTGGRSGFQYFTYEESPFVQIQTHGESLNATTARKAHFQQETLKTLYHEQQAYNHFVQDCELVGDEMKRVSADFDIQNAEEITRLKAVINVKTCSFDIAAITSDTTTGDRIITYKLKNCSKAQCIPSTHNCFEPLSYPLLFPRGEPGWGVEIKKDFPFADYLRTRMLAGEWTEDGEPLLCDSAETLPDGTPKRRLRVNRCQIMARLGQLYLVDMMSRAIDFRLNWQKLNQSYMFGGHPNAHGADENAAEEPGRGNSVPSYLSQSIHGSRRHLRERAHNALALVSHFGHPTLFITLTCNPRWEEITEQLLKGQSSFDRPDLVCRIFHAKLQAYLKNLRAGKYFHEWKTVDGVRTKVPIAVEYELEVIEYQHRGMPHAHIVVRFKGNIFET